MWLCFAHEAPRHVFRNLQRSQLPWIQLLATPLSACTVLIQSQSLERWEFYERVTTHSTSPRVRKPPSREPPEHHKTSSALDSNACCPAVKSTFSTFCGSYLSTRFAPANAFVFTACWFDEPPSGNH